MCQGNGEVILTHPFVLLFHFLTCYMLLYLGVMSHENMQMEGFWYYLFLGVFEAATIHYAVAKIFGPLFFGAVGVVMPAGRPWCWIFYLTNSRKSHEKRSLVFFVM